jgi:putative FmdB family regulatory protein
MPIYAYRCESCGFAQDMLRKISDPPLSVCPECNKDTFRKQVTAAGFQLKGSGWYVTDFRNNGGAPASTGKSGGATGSSESASSSSGDTSGSAASGAAASSSASSGASTPSSASTGSSSGTAASGGSTSSS